MCNCRDVYEICISSKQGVKMAGLVMTEMCNCRDVYEICISSKQGVKMAGLVMTLKCVTVEMYMKFVFHKNRV